MSSKRNSANLAPVAQRADRDKNAATIRWHREQAKRHQALADALIDQPAAGPLSAAILKRRRKSEPCKTNQ